MQYIISVVDSSSNWMNNSTKVVTIVPDKNVEPDDQMLKEAFGETSIIWEKIKQHLNSEYGVMTEEWRFYNQKSGWIMKTLKKKRNLFFPIPLKNYFKLNFVFGDKAVKEVEKSDLPEGIINDLKNTRKYVEGRGIQIEVKSDDDFENIKKLIAIKIHN